VIEVREHIPADGVLLERSGILAEANGVEPLPETCHAHEPVRPPTRRQSIQ
jgi:hypothetical protein